MAASVKILVVSWNDAAEINESVLSAAFVIPNNNGLKLAGLAGLYFTTSFFDFLRSLLIASAVFFLYYWPSLNKESPAFSITILFDTLKFSTKKSLLCA